MSFKSTLFAGLAALSLATTALAGEAITILDPYARSAMSTASSGAAFMTIHNAGTEDDRLIGVRSDIAKKVELHTNKEDAGGVMRMIPIEGGIDLPAGSDHKLKRGGDHVMLMGLNKGLQQGESFPLVLVFEKAGEVRVEVPVDQTRKPGQ